MASLILCCHVDYNASQDGDASAEEEEEVHDIETSKKMKRPKGASGKTSKSEEDTVLCLAWMAINQDLITGAKQGRESYWCQIHKDLKKKKEYHDTTSCTLIATRI